jgi:ribosomal protein S18 acetylase RimI-like enzyme
MDAWDVEGGIFDMSITIRNMHEGDFDTVRQIESAAFGEWERSLRGPEATPLPPRTRANILSRMARDPEGCFVAEEDGCPLGFIFSCTWGRVGWFGTFSVLPAHQGRGIGKRLIEASVGYLRQCEIPTIGLATMPESPYNIGLYVKMGFQPRLITPILSKPLVEQPPGDSVLPCWSAADEATRMRWLAEIQEATGQIPPGFDYGREIILTERFALGETLILSDGGRAIGLSNVLLENTREGGTPGDMIVQALALHPDTTSEEAFRTLLAATEALASARGGKTLFVAVNSRHIWALERLLAWGYRVERALVRMRLAGTVPEPVEDRLVNLSRWSG